MVNLIIIHIDILVCVFQSKLALPNITEALRNLTYVFQGMSTLGQQEVVLEDDVIYVSTEIVPAYQIQGFDVVRPRVIMSVETFSETSPKQCNSSALIIRVRISYYLYK